MLGGTNQSKFSKGVSNSSSCSHIADIVISCIQKRLNFINRGLIEIKNLQAENFTAEKFAISTYTRILEGFEKDFLSIEKQTEVHTYSLITGNMKVSKGDLTPKYRLIFNPLDNIFNFSRGIENVGTSFSLEELSQNKETNYKGVLTGFYHFKQQKFLHGQQGEIAYLENKRVKAIQRQNNFVVATNRACFSNGHLTEEKLKAARINQILITESPVSDIFFLAGGALDGIIYNNIKLKDAIPIILIAPLMGTFIAAPTFEKTDLLKEISFVIGTSNFIKNFSYFSEK